MLHGETKDRAVVARLNESVVLDSTHTQRGRLESVHKCLCSALNIGIAPEILEMMQFEQEKFD